MVSPVNFAHASTIIEVGPGTGAITDVILERLLPQNRYIGIELNKKFHHMLTMQYKTLDFVNGNAQDMQHILTTLNIEAVDAVVCSLPWASFDVKQQLRMVNAIRRCMKPGSVFITFAYLQGMALPGAWMLRNILKTRFASVEKTKTVWNNVPPAFAYVCYR